MDGSIRIQTVIDNDLAKKGFKDLVKMAENAKDEVQEFSENLGFGDMSEQEVAKVEKAFSSIDKRVKKYGTKLSSALIDEDTIRAKVGEIQNEIERATRREMENVGWSENDIQDEIVKRMESNKELQKQEALLAKAHTKTDEIAESLREELRAREQLALKTADTLNGEREKTAEIERQKAEAEKIAIAQARQKEKQEETNRAINQAKSATIGFGDSMKKSLTHSLKRLKQFALGLVGIRAMYSLMSQASNTILSQNETLANQLSGLKNALATAFTPILEGIINMAVKAISYINALITAFTGINLIAKSNQKAIKATGASAKQAQAQLAGFDEMNVLSDNSGGGGGASGNGQLELNDVSGEEFYNKIRDAIERGDWSGVGSVIADKINEAMDKIDWNKIKDKCKNVATNIAEFLNGFIRDFDWGKLAKTLSNAFTTILDTVKAFVSNLDIGAIVDAIFNYFAGIDWAGIAESVLGLAGSIFGKIGEFGKEILVHLWDGIKSYFQPFVDENKELFGDGGTAIVFGIFEGIMDAIENVKNWIKEHIFQPFWDGMCEAFGIHSPSTKMKEIGGYIVDGFKEGVKNIWEKVKEIFSNLKNNIINTFSNIWNNIITGATNAWTGIKNAFSVTVEWFRSIFDSVKAKVQGAWDGMKTGAQNAWNSIKSIFSTVASYFGSIFSSAWQKVRDIFSKGGTGFASITEGISSAFRSIVNSLIGGINNVISVPFNKINNIMSTIRNASIAGIKPFAGLIPYINIPQIPRLALGGVTAQPTFAQIGEAGREAVLPLTNKSIMDELGKTIGEYIQVGQGDVTIPIYLGNKEIARYNVNVSNRQAYATNGGKW